MEKKHFGGGGRESVRWREREMDREGGNDLSMPQRIPRPQGRQDLCYHLKH